MPPKFDLTIRAAQTQSKLREVHGVRGRDLSQSLRRARRFLPRRLTRHARDIEAAQALTGHPKLERMIDHDRLDRHMSAIDRELALVDVVERRRTRAIALATQIFFYVLLAAAGFISWMVWAGHL